MDEELPRVEAEDDAPSDDKMVVNGKKQTKLDKQLAGTKSIDDKLIEIYKSIDKGFMDASTRINDQMDYWDIAECDFNSNQFYQGNSQVYLPIVADAIEARTTRFTNQMFPSSGHAVEVVTPDGKLPMEWMAILEHYIETSHLRDLVVPSMFTAGDVEGQWNLYVTWNHSEREVRYRVNKPIEDEGIPIEGTEGEGGEDIETRTIPAMSPCVEVISDADVMVLPASARSVEDALDRGGSVTILRRWTKGDIDRMIDDGTFIESRAKPFLDALGQDKSRTDMTKKHVDQAGIQSAGKYLLGYETWTKVKVDGEKRLCVAYYGDPSTVLGAFQNPYWCNLGPLISAPVKKKSGSFKGVPPIKKVASLQYAANDIINEGLDSATYALMPIVMTDPARNPRMGSMVMNLAAVWEVNPDSTKFASMPTLWKDAFEMVNAIKSQVQQSLGVNPSMMPGTTGGKKKLSQAEIANEQQVDILTTANVVTSAEKPMSQVLQRFAWYDAQFREDQMLVRMYGRAGRKATMEMVEPIQMNTRYYFKWLGVEAARSAQQVQQQISFMNVLNGIPPQRYPGRRMDFVPIIERAVENIYGPRLGPLVFQDMEDQLAIPPQEENGMLEHGFELPVSPLDNDILHLQSHQQLFMATNDPHGVIRVHMMAHMQQLQAKQQQMAQGPGGPGQPGKPGMGGSGVAGQPGSGAVTAGPHAGKEPDGAIHPDQMPLSMPRKM